MNTETIRNPCTNERKPLLEELEEQECQIDFREAAFSEAEYPTMVEVALIYAKKKASSEMCITFEHFKRRVKREHTEGFFQNSMTRYVEVSRLVDNYQAEVWAALSL